MLVGIKYCGGCNPAYDRGGACAGIRKVFQDDSRESGSICFEFAEAGKGYDTLLVISGCPCRCADISEYGYERLISMWKPGQDEEVVEALRRAAGIAKG